MSINIIGYFYAAMAQLITHIANIMPFHQPYCVKGSTLPLSLFKSKDSSKPNVS